MAYLNRLASVPLGEVEALRNDPESILAPSLNVFVSHLIAYWVQVQPLGELLGRAVDGGDAINPSLRHQLRDPCFHAPDAVRLLYPQLLQAWDVANAENPAPPDDWYRIEIEKVLRVFAHAVERGECVVSTVEPCHVIHFARKP
jgi:hypothetical protein